MQELTNKTVFILGTGSIGQEIAKRLKAFDCKIVGFNRSETKPEHFDEINNISKFSELVPQADIIVSALPLDDSTHHLINADIISSLKEDAILVNVSRGAIVDTEALVTHINNIKGAILDVFEDEPLPETHAL